MTDTTTELHLECTRFIPAPPEKLFDAWLDPGMLSRFMRPGENMTVPEATTNPKVGGQFMILMRVGDQDMPHTGTYKTIDRPDRLVFTWESAASTIEDSTVTIDFEAAEGGTNVRLEHVRFPSEEIRDNHKGGWTRILETLAAQV